MARKPLTLREINKVAYDFLLAHPRCNLFADVGSGKTLDALLVQDALRLCGLIDKPTLVLGPLRVARDTWPEEAAKWDVFKDTRVSVVVGTLDQRLAALKREAEIYTVNYEQLPWLVEHYQDKWPFGTVIADESTRLKSFRLNKSGERAKAIARVAHTLTDRWINLTGTPSPNGLKDLWGQMWFIDRGQRLGRTYTAFMERWFRTGYSGFGIVPFPHSAAEIHALIADVSLTLDPRDFFDVREPHVTQIDVTLPPKALAFYLELERAMYAEFEDFSIEAFNAGALTNKCCQAANGAVYTEYPSWKSLHNAKLEALESISSETSDPLLVGYYFKSDLERLKKTFPKGVDLAHKDGLVAFKSGYAPFGWAHPGSVGHGIDGLQHVCHNLVRFGHSWNLEHTLQLLGRIGPTRQFQAGLNRVVNVYNLVARDTIDEVMIARYHTKVSVQDALLAACKRRK